MKYTDTMRHEVRGIQKGSRWLRFRPEFTLTEWDFHKVAPPTLLLRGEDEPFGGPELGRWAATAVKNVALQTFPESGHLPWLHNPEIHTSLVCIFLAPNENVRAESGALKG